MRNSIKHTNKKWKSIILVFICTCSCLYSQSINAQNAEGKDIYWASFKDLSNETYSKKFNEYSKKGLILIDVDAYISKGKTLYAMVWKENTDKLGWYSFRNMSPKNYYKKKVEMKKKGYRLLDVECYPLGTKNVYAAIWIQNKDHLNWSSKQDLSSSQFGSYFKKMKSKGYRPIDIEAYKIGNIQRYAAIWIQNKSNLKWIQLRDMSRESYQKKVDELSKDGYLVEDYERYTLGNVVRYAAIWVQRPGVRYQLRTNQDDTSFNNIWREYLDLGYRLIDFEREGNAYAGVWIQNNINRIHYPKKDKIDNIINTYKNSKSLSGISVAIIKDGYPIYRKGFGNADKKNNKKAWTGTVYLQASISKVIGGTLAVKLIDKGQLENGKSVTLDLNKKTSTYLTHLKTSTGNWVSIPKKHKHTVAQLLSHLSCIKHYEGPTPVEKHYTKAIDALIQIWDADFVPNCTIGYVRDYSTHAFTYFAAVLEEITGQTSAQLIKNEITNPYNLGSMRAMYGKEELPYNYDRAVPYAVNGTTEISYKENSWKIFGGGIESSTYDLARFGWKVLNGDIVSSCNRDHLLWKRVHPYRTNGIGWKVSSNGNIIEHGGIEDGATSLIKIYKAEKLVIAINTNMRSGTLDTLANNLTYEILNTTN